MDILWQDLRYGLRTLRRSPVFMLVAVLTLALGIGATAAIFTVVNAALLRPLPYPQPDRIVHFVWRSTHGTMDALSDLEANYWARHTRAFATVASYQAGNASLVIGRGLPERVGRLNVSSQFFNVLDVHPAIGRTFTHADTEPGSPRVVIISDGLWRRQFGADPRMLGRSLRIDGLEYTVVGVMPRAFAFVEPYAAPPQLWTARQIVVNPLDKGHNTEVIGRLRSGVALGQARADVARLDSAFRSAYPGYLARAEIGADVVSYRSWIGHFTRTPLLVLLGAALLVLLIAATNVANLLVARQAARETELAVRRALGASAWRVFSQIATECLTLAVLGGTAGVVLAYWVVGLFLALSPTNYFPLVGRPTPDARVLVFCLLLVGGTTLLMAVVSAFHIVRIDLNHALREGGRGASGGVRQRLRNLLTAGEVAVSIVLLAGALLLLASLGKLSAVNPGFSRAHLWTFDVPLPPARYRTSAEVERFGEAVSNRLRALPGVTAAAMTTNLPMEYGFNFPVQVNGGRGPKSAYVQGRLVSPGYFATLGVPLERGRAITATDTAGSQPVVVINEALARQCCAGRDPLQAQVSLAPGLPIPQGAPMQVVGVVADSHDLGLGRAVVPMVFIPQAQAPDALTAMSVGWFGRAWIVRTEKPLSRAAVQQAVAAVDPTQPVTHLASMTALERQSIGPQTFMSVLIGSFAGIALLLAALGLYGVIAYSVAQRTHEIGLRMALGASMRDVVALVIRQGLVLVAAGVVVGLTAAAGVTRFLRSFLFGVTPLDPYVLVAIVVVFAVVALVASGLPAYRAVRIDPAIALRIEN